MSKSLKQFKRDKKLEYIENIFTNIISKINYITYKIGENITLNYEDIKNKKWFTTHIIAIITTSICVIINGIGLKYCAIIYLINLILGFNYIWDRIPYMRKCDSYTRSGIFMVIQLIAVITLILELLFKYF